MSMDMLQRGRWRWFSSFWFTAVFVLRVQVGAGEPTKPTFLEYNAALKTKWASADADIVARCEDVVGYPHLFILWERSPPKNNERFLDSLEKTDGIDVMEVHTMHFEQGADGFAECHLNFYTNNNCGKEPSYSQVFMSRDYLSRMKGVGPFTVVLYKFNCTDTNSQAILNLWRGLYSDYLRALKASLRKQYSTVSKFTIHGTMNRLESMVDIESLFGPEKFGELTKLAKQGLRWSGQIVDHKTSACPVRRTRPCETTYENGYDLVLK